MKRKFKPYLDIKDKKHLQLLLYRQLAIEENNFPEAEVEDFTENSFRMLADKFKKFYGYEPSKEYKEYIDDIIYFLLVNRYFINLTDKVVAAMDSAQKEKSDQSAPLSPSKMAAEEDNKKPNVLLQIVGDKIVSVTDYNNILSKDQLDEFKKLCEKNSKNRFIAIAEDFMKSESYVDINTVEKMLHYMGKSIKDIDMFISRHYGKGFYSLNEACSGAFENIDFNDLSNAKVILDKLQMILSKVQTVLFLLGTNVKQLRFHMIIAILTSRRLEISVKSLSRKTDEIYDLVKKLKNNLKQVIE